MPKSQHFRCRICGRSTTYNRQKQLCSFCSERERDLEKQRMENRLKGYDIHYCKNCGKRIYKKTYKTYGDYCSACFELKKLKENPELTKIAYEETLEGYKKPTRGN